MKRQHKSHNMSHFLLGAPVKIFPLSVDRGVVVRPVTAPELGFKSERVKSREDFKKESEPFEVERDAEKAAEAFMSIQTFEDALAVFSVYGPLYEYSPSEDSNFVSFEEIQKWIRASWKMRTAGISDLMRWWEAAANKPYDSVPEELRDALSLTLGIVDMHIRLVDPPILEINSADDIMRSLFIVLHLEKLEGIRHKYCALPDCRKPFELKGDKDRKFCSYDCSHKAAVRASRKRAKEAKAKKSSKRSTRG